MCACQLTGNDEISVLEKALNSDTAVPVVS
jgi:hypothetical protein